MHLKRVTYRSLRARTLLPQLLAFAVLETVLFVSYLARDARADWAVHLLVGVLAASVWLSAYLLILAKPAPGQLLTLGAGHLLAMAPDLLLLVGVAHQEWMNIFLHHLAVQEPTGGPIVWLLPAGLVLAGYVALLACWLRARNVEATRGLCPGIGIGGMAVVRAQRDPRTGQLAHRHRGLQHASAPLVMLLHGLGGTSAIWNEIAGRLDEAGLATLCVDLLGHGGSLSLGTRFGLIDQVRAITSLLDHHGSSPVAIVGHSWGAAVAVAVARDAPNRLEQLVLITPPAFAEPRLAHRRLGARSWLDRRTVSGKPDSRVACGMMCLLRRPLGALAAHVLPGLSPEVARGSVAHTYPAFRAALDALLAPDNVLAQAIRRPSHPTSVLLGSRDNRVHPGDVRALRPAAAVDIVQVPGDHHLPLTAPELVAGFLLARLRRDRTEPS